MRAERLFIVLMAAIVIAMLILAVQAVQARAAGERGVASFYDDGPGRYAAVHSFYWGDTPYRVRVTADNGRSVVVVVRDHCNCYTGTPDERLIDLSPEAFRALGYATEGGPGLIWVRVDRIRPEDPDNHTSFATAPPTDTDEGPTVAGRAWRIAL